MRKASVAMLVVSANAFAGPVTVGINTNSVGGVSVSTQANAQSYGQGQAVSQQNASAFVVGNASHSVVVSSRPSLVSAGSVQVGGSAQSYSHTVGDALASGSTQSRGSLAVSNTVQANLGAVVLGSTGRAGATADNAVSSYAGPGGGTVNTSVTSGTDSQFSSYTSGYRSVGNTVNANTTAVSTGYTTGAMYAYTGAAGLTNNGGVTQGNATVTNKAQIGNVCIGTGCPVGG